MPNYKSAISLLFFTNPQKVFKYFLEHKNEEFFDRDIAIKTGLSYSGTNFALRDLAKVGLLTRTEKGKMVYYKLNQDNKLVYSYVGLEL